MKIKLNYGVCIWDPHLKKKHTEYLELIQKRGEKMMRH